MELEEAELLGAAGNDSWNSSWAGGWDGAGAGGCSANLGGVFIAARLVYALVCGAGLAGNSLVIYVVLRYSGMQTVTNTYIVNLAVADECFLIGIPFLVTTMSLRAWPFGSFMCKAYMATTGVNQFTSSIFLCIMSADRYVAVCHPVAAPRLRTPRVARALAAAAWLASALLMAPLLMYTTLVPTEHGLSCNIVWPESALAAGQAAFTLYSFALGFAAPLTLIFVFYCLVLRRLRTVGPKHKSKEKKRSHRKVTKLVLTVIAVYVLCWLPYWACQVALIYSPPTECASRVTVAVFLLAACFSYSNSAMNPILYAFLSDNFKKSFLKACSCAAPNELNNTLQLDHSVPPRKRGPRGSRAASRGPAPTVRGPPPTTTSESLPLEARPCLPPPAAPLAPAPAPARL